MKVTILGAGRWGSTIAWVQNKQGREVILWNRDDEFLQEWFRTRKNKYLSLPKSVEITSDINKALENEVIFIAIRVQHFRDLCQNLAERKPQNKLFILAMKGLEEGTGKSLSEIFNEFLGSENELSRSKAAKYQTDRSSFSEAVNPPSPRLRRVLLFASSPKQASGYSAKENKLGILAGPGHPQELSKNIPTVMTCSTQDESDLERAVEYCQTDLMKIIPNKDFIGVEVGAALKNIMGLVGGMLVALDMPSFKSYILARGPVEVGRLIKAVGGNYQTAFGLSHLGDYGATVFSGFSYNHQAGEMWVKEKKLSKKAEGIPTVKAVKLLAEKYKIEMPICEAVYQVLYEDMEPKDLVKVLMERETEFE